MFAFSADTCVILVGHGAPPRGIPRELVTRFKALEGRRHATGGPPSPEEREVDAKIRSWPRDAANDPYREGILALARALAPRVEPARLRVAFNEFCAPSLEQALRDAAAEGAARVIVVPSMLTPGGVHSEEEIPEIIASLRGELASMEIIYAWPFDLGEVAALLAQRALAASR